MSTLAEDHREDFQIPKAPAALFGLGSTPATGTSDELTPPSDTSFFKVEDFTIFNDKSVSTPSGLHHVDARVTWKVRTYMYGTGSDPRKPDDYAKYGGETFIVMVHSGSVYSSPTPHVGQLEFGMKLNSSEQIAFFKQLPAPDSGVEDGHNWKYNIEFGQNLAMRKNDGQDPAPFKAIYTEPFTTIGCEHVTYKHDDAQCFGISPGDLKYMQVTNEVHGFTVLNTKKGGDWKPTITFSFTVFTDSPIDDGTTVTQVYTPSLKFEF